MPKIYPGVSRETGAKFRETRAKSRERPQKKKGVPLTCMITHENVTFLLMHVAITHVPCPLGLNRLSFLVSLAECSFELR